MKDFTHEQLAQHDGHHPDLPMLISIRGVVFDVSSGKQFYGPNGEHLAYRISPHFQYTAVQFVSVPLADCGFAVHLLFLHVPHQVGQQHTGPAVVCCRYMHSKHALYQLPM